VLQVDLSGLISESHNGSIDLPTIRFCRAVATGNHGPKALVYVTGCARSRNTGGFKPQLIVTSPDCRRVFVLTRIVLNYKMPDRRGQRDFKDPSLTLLLTMKISVPR